MSTSTEKIERELAKLLAAHASTGAEGGRPLRIVGTTDLNRDLGLESIQIMEFVVDVEDHYDISIPLESLSKARTLGDMAVVVAGLMGGGE